MLSRLSEFLRVFPFLLRNFRSGKATAIDIELSNRCNLRCRMCWFHGEKGIGDQYEGSELKTDELIGFIDQVAEHKPRIYLGGSEPFIREDLLSILEHIKKSNLSVMFSSNGTLLDSEKNKALVNLGVDHVIFSIDGYEQLHDQIRGEGIFRKVTSNIKQLSEMKKQNNSDKPIISVNMTVTPFIVGHLEESIRTIREATEDRVDFYRIHHLWYLTQKELLAHQSKIDKLLNCSAPGALSHLLRLAKDIDPLALSNEIRQLKDISKIKSFPNLRHNDIPTYYSDRSHIKYRCFAPFCSAVIKPNGDVRFCPDEWIDDYTLGNIRDDSFQNIWNNKKARYFRSVIFWHQSFAGCKRCSFMYSF